MDSTHTEIQRQLEAQLNRLTHRIGRIGKDLRSAHDPAWVEEAPERETAEVLERLDSAGRLEVSAIRTALARLGNGTYEQCSKCGQRIDRRRLVAMPTTTTCLDCSI